jgi:hypothetical protein
VFSSFDELWGYTSERSRRLWDEMVPSPVRRISCRLVTTYAGFEGESTLLEELYKRGLAQEQIGIDLRAGDGLLMFWSHTPSEHGVCRGLEQQVVDHGLVLVGDVGDRCR